jgi:hypothetical protein
MRSLCSLCIRESSYYLILMREPAFKKLGMYVMAPELISWAYFINPSHQSLCLYAYPPTVARQRLGKLYPAFHC